MHNHIDEILKTQILFFIFLMKSLSYYFQIILEKWKLSINHDPTRRTNKSTWSPIFMKFIEN